LIFGLDASSRAHNAKEIYSASAINGSFVTRCMVDEVIFFLKSNMFINVADSKRWLSSNCLSSTVRTALGLISHQRMYGRCRCWCCWSRSAAW